MPIWNEILHNCNDDDYRKLLDVLNAQNKTQRNVVGEMTQRVENDVKKKYLKKNHFETINWWKMYIEMECPST